MYTRKIDRVLFVRMYKMTRYYLSACSNRRGTICPRVQIDGVLFVRICKTTAYYLSANAKMMGYYFAWVLFVSDSKNRLRLEFHHNIVANNRDHANVCG